MNKILGLCAGLLLLTACSESIEDKAGVYLELAEQAYAKGAYEVAREKIDSIRLLYPKAINTRRSALELRQKVDLAEGQQAVEEADKIIQQKTDLVERLKGKMVFEPIKGTVGNYVSPYQTVDKIAHNMLRAQVDEHGLLTLTAIYCGRLDYRSVKVECQGQSLQTPISSAFFLSESRGQLLEEVVFSNDCEVGISAFLSQHVGHKVMLTYLGKTQSKTITMDPEDVKAVSDIYDLYLQMKILNDARVRYADACGKIKFLHRKMEEANSSVEQKD